MKKIMLWTGAGLLAGIFLWFPVIPVLKITWIWPLLYDLIFLLFIVRHFSMFNDCRKYAKRRVSWLYASLWIPLACELILEAPNATISISILFYSMIFVNEVWIQEKCFLHVSKEQFFNGIFLLIAIGFINFYAMKTFHENGILLEGVTFLAISQVLIYEIHEYIFWSRTEKIYREIYFDKNGKPIKWL